MNSPGNSSAAGWPRDVVGEQQRLLDRAVAEGVLRRLFARDGALWTGGDEARWLGWLEPRREHAEQALALAVRLRERGEFNRVVVVGMGGSSLGAAVLYRLAPPPLSPLGRSRCELTLLDTTHPEEVARSIAEAKENDSERSRARRSWTGPNDGETTLFVLASKSGSTLETKAVGGILLERFAGDRFVVVTDPGSALAAQAEGRRVAAIVWGDPEIGGRFSVLSPFGLVPAALAGVDVATVIEGARQEYERLLDAASDATEGRTGDALALGCLWAAATARGRDKLRIPCDTESRPLADWVEQLVAESTGKQGKGLLPRVAERTAGEEPTAPDFAASDELIWALPRASIDGSDSRDSAPAAQLGATLYRCMVATAVCGWALRINPFDQPDVEFAKRQAHRLLQDAAVETTTGEGMGAEPDARRLRELAIATRPPGYLALLSYLPRSASTRRRLDELAAVLVSESTVARSAAVAPTNPPRFALFRGDGPRYLHSIGQAFKGGPENGRFVFLLAEPAVDLNVDFGESGASSLARILRAQALGDAAELRRRGREVLVVDLGSAPLVALDRLLEQLR